MESIVKPLSISPAQENRRWLIRILRQYAELETDSSLFDSDV
jgi:hypothetical protein